MRGKVVLGVDPGFKNGCKWALTSETGRYNVSVCYILFIFFDISELLSVIKSVTRETF